MTTVPQRRPTSDLQQRSPKTAFKFQGLVIQEQTAWNMRKVEAFQNLISEVEKKELKDMKYRIRKSEEPEPDPSPFVNPYRIVDRYNYDGKIFKPSYFQVKRTPQDDMFLENIDKEDFQRCKQSKKTNIVNYEVCWILANDPDFNIWDSAKEMAKRVGDVALYDNTIRAVATLIFSLYPSETLFRLHHGHSHHTQLNKLWEKIQQLNTPSLPELCNAITHCNINYNEYPFVTQSDMDSFIYHYVNGLIYSEARGRAPDVCYPPPQHKKDAMFNEMHEVVAKMESPKSMEGDLDDYTRLLIKLASEASWNKKKELVDRVMAVINTSCEEWKSKMKIYVLSMIKFEECRIKNMRSSVGQPLYHLVYGNDLCAHDPRVLVCADVWEVIEVAEFRREALGSRFIKRNHLLWAFYELGFGLPREYISGTFKLDIEDEDRPPYHIYLASIKLAKSLGEEIVQLQHFIFVVLNLKDNVDDENLATEMKEQFRAFLRDAASDGVMRPNANADSWLKNILESTHVN